MIRSEIIEAFRVDNPEITSRVITDPQLYEYCEQGDKDFCAETRCIYDQDGTAWTPAVGDKYYDLTSKITNFYDIDDTYASGVVYNGKRLDKATMSELDTETPTWRANANGTPRKWYRRGKYLYLDRGIDTAGTNYVRVYAILNSDDWNTNVAPYNQISYLVPFHRAMVLYLAMRCKQKIGKVEESQKAQAEYQAYVAWSKKQLLGNKSGMIFFRRRI